MKFKVSYSENVQREIDIEADSAEEAESMVMDGSADYDESCEVDATVVSVNSVEELKEENTVSIREKYGVPKPIGVRKK